MGTKDYAEYYERLTSYTNWAGDVTIYVKALVEAGFVYSGENDTVFCYKCGVAAKGWKEDDDPIKRHEDLNKTCYFLSERSRNIVGGQEIPCSSLADFEEQQTVYDWVPGTGVVNRKDGNAHGSGVTKNAMDDQNATVGTVNLAGLHKREMRFERSRFEGYAMCDIHKHWPSPEQLSSKGFYYDAKRKVTCCFCCGATVETWESSSQDVDQKHKSMSPNCRFLNKEPCGNVLLNEDMEEFRDERKLFDALSINKEAENKRNAIDPYVAFPNQRQESYQNNAHQQYQPPRYLGGQYAPTHTPTIRPNGYVDPPKSPMKKDPRKSSGDYSDETKRLNTFFTWPQTAYIEPIELARAGFIYSGTGDAVKCYKCGVSLRNWEPNDNAWAEHEKWSPNCKLVIECIQEAQRIKNTPPHMIQESSYSSLNEAQIRQNHLQHLLLQQQQHPNESSRSLPTGVGNQYALNQYARQNKLTNTEQPNYDNYRSYMNDRQTPRMQHMYNVHHPVNQPNMTSQNPSYHNPLSNHINLTSHKHTTIFEYDVQSNENDLS
ncbi:E3 ubiquitin-protein ligase XIAP-like [Clytia hemisphaerica]|uniref:Inhibitor of apoptosis protein n=1 Tax=Clytia hemisphaerica TaxID=252671 RepID=A0A7M5V7N5_9CNID